MIEIVSGQDGLYLKYEPERAGVNWVEGELNAGGITIRKVFHFDRNDIVQLVDAEAVADEDDEDDRLSEVDQQSYTFKLGVVEGEYYRISPTTLNTDHSVFIALDRTTTVRDFLAVRDISVFGHLDRLSKADIYVGGSHPTAIPNEVFERLLKSFPNSTELWRYADAKISRLVKDHLQASSDAEKAFEKFLARRTKPVPTGERRTLIDVYAIERGKYEFIRERIVELLAEENSYSEAEWQKLMLQFILVIFPKYICVLHNVHIKDYYSAPGIAKNRFIDLMLLDANGNADVIEIKKPFANFLLGDKQYRENFVPRGDLSGTIMQAEKYLFHLNKWGVEGERQITKKKKEKLPSGINVRITNPRAIVIAGRTTGFTAAQKFDFEVIKRKYANMMDILSYDDLLFRLDNIIKKFIVGPDVAT